MHLEIVLFVALRKKLLVTNELGNIFSKPVYKNNMALMRTTWRELTVVRSGGALRETKVL